MIKIIQIFAALLLKILVISDHSGSSFLPSSSVFTLLVAGNNSWFTILPKSYHKIANFWQVKIHKLVCKHDSASSYLAKYEVCPKITQPNFEKSATHLSFVVILQNHLLFAGGFFFPLMTCLIFFGAAFSAKYVTKIEKQEYPWYNNGTWQIVIGEVRRMKCALAAVGFINGDIKYNKATIMDTLRKCAGKADVSLEKPFCKDFTVSIL